jgi:hypothetical protein
MWLWALIGPGISSGCSLHEDGIMRCDVQHNQKLSRRFIVMFSDKSTNEADNPIYHRTNNKQQIYLNKLLDISRIIPYTWTVAGDGG